MIVTVNADVVRLDEPGDCTAFHVRVEDGTENQVMQALAQVGRMHDHDIAWIAVDAVKAMAAGRVEPGWDAEFALMLEYAASKGWLDDARSEIQAHIEW